MARRSNTSFRIKQVFIVFILIMFLGGTIGGFAMFYANPGNTDGQRTQDREFVFTNIFNSSVDFSTKQNAIRPANPQQHPNVPINRKLGGVWIEYSCGTGCPQLVSQLKSLIQEYDERVYISPADRNATLYLQANQNTQFMDTANMAEVRSFICNSLIAPPDVCALRSLTENNTNGTNQPTLPG